MAEIRGEIELRQKQRHIQIRQLTLQIASLSVPIISGIAGGIERNRISYLLGLTINEILMAF